MDAGLFKSPILGGRDGIPSSFVARGSLEPRSGFEIGFGPYRHLAMALPVSYRQPITAKVV